MGYDLKVSNKEFGLDSIKLRLRCPDNSEFLADVDYAQHLLQLPLSVPFLLAILSPLKDIFNEMNYGRPYNVLITQLENTVAINGSADVSDNSMNTNDASIDVQVKEEELEEEERNTDDENVLFGQIEESLMTSSAESWS
ncbi:hypothetical protein ACHAXA_009973 [Cyclostephanos tholiformis]|uniref:Uncharacterized protein n=1 Tax=Cyclostephanos tholiformis TaxID=382380 RepID=A0ABD3R8E5_9STRA